MNLLQMEEEFPSVTPAIYHLKNIPGFEYQREFLEKHNYINNGRLTHKGQSSIVYAPKYLSNTELSKRLNLFLYEILSRGQFKSNVQFWNNETINIVLESILNIVFEKIQSGEFQLDPNVVAYMEYMQPQDLEPPVVQEVIVEENVLAVQEVPKPKRTKKEKVTV